MTSSVRGRAAQQARYLRLAGRPTRVLESAVGSDGTIIQVGDAVEFAPGRTTIVTRIEQEPSGTSKAYEEPILWVTNTMVGGIYASQVRKAV